jgi:uncharacterized oligopeptide transporter (OPT) family protein
MKREITWQSIVGAGVIAAVVSAAYPYVVLRIGTGPNVSVVAAFLGAIFLSLTARKSLGQNRFANNVIQTAGTSAAMTAFMCIVAAAFGYLDVNPTVDVHVHISRTAMFLWLTCSGVIGVLLTVFFRRMFIEDPEMVFADGVAAAETVIVLDAPAGHERSKTRALGVSAALSAAVHFVVEAVPAFFGKTLVPYLMLSPRFAMGFDWSLLTIGTGMLLGLRQGLSMIFGALLLWFVIGPYVMDGGIGLSIVHASIAPEHLATCERLASAGLAALKPADAQFLAGHCGLYGKYLHQDHFRIVLAWAMWPATALMVTSALTAVLLRWRSIVATFRDLRAASTGRVPSEDVAPRTVLIGAALATVLLAIVQRVSFGMSFLQTAIAVLASLPLMLVGIRVLGETNQGPISVMANALQALFAVFWPGAIGLNLVAAGVSGSVSAQSQGTIQDYKTGKIVGSTPRVLTWVQLGAVPIGAAAVAIMYPVLVKAYGLGDRLAAPTGLKIANMAVLLSKGLGALPEGALSWTIIAAIGGVVMGVLGNTRLAKFLPSAAAFGFALILPGTLNLPMGLGGVLAYVWYRKSPQSYEKFGITVASGLIAGEALLGGVVVPIVMTLLSH